MSRDPWEKEREDFHKGLRPDLGPRHPVYGNRPHVPVNYGFGPGQTPPNIGFGHGTTNPSGEPVPVRGDLHAEMEAVYGAETAAVIRSSTGLGGFLVDHRRDVVKGLELSVPPSLLAKIPQAFRDHSLLLTAFLLALGIDPTAERLGTEKYGITMLELSEFVWMNQNVPVLDTGDQVVTVKELFKDQNTGLGKHLVRWETFYIQMLAISTFFPTMAGTRIGVPKPPTGVAVTRTGSAGTGPARTATQLSRPTNIPIRPRVPQLGAQRPTNFPVAARDRAALEKHFGKDSVAPLGGRDEANVLVVTVNGRKQVWVRPQYTDYKGAYEAVHGRVQQGFDVDHLQSRGRGWQQQYGYVRLEKVQSSVNQAWGREFEKLTVNMGRKGYIEPSGPAPIRCIDQFQWWKLQGYSPQQVFDAFKRLKF